MALWIGTCPHCNAEKMTFTTSTIDVLSQAHGNAFFTCPSCSKPIALRFSRPVPGRTVGGGGSPKSAPGDLHGKWKGTIADAGYNTTNVWPVHSPTAAPDSVPTAVARNFVQAEEARKRQHREAAGMAYRRALELALKDIAPDLKGTLEKRINKLAEVSKLTPDLAAWAHSVRELGNEATHDEPEPTDVDVEDLGAFTRVVLEYLYTMPEKVQKRTSKPIKPLDEAPEALPAKD
jgi:hypothetical protein